MARKTAVSRSKSKSPLVDSYFGAKLLFQFRVVGAKTAKKRLVEERVVLFRADSPERAFTMAMKFGHDCEYRDRHLNGIIAFEFIGVKELAEILDYAPQDQFVEVWWEFQERILPKERKSKLLPQRAELRAFRRMSPRRFSPFTGVGSAVLDED